RGRRPGGRPRVLRTSPCRQLRLGHSVPPAGLRTHSTLVGRASSGRGGSLTRAGRSRTDRRGILRGLLDVVSSCRRSWATCPRKQVSQVTLLDNVSMNPSYFATFSRFCTTSGQQMAVNTTRSEEHTSELQSRF